MQRCSYQLTFTTPAFLGNAEQQAQWRTPPIKALLRQWWRVAVAHDIAYDVDKLRQREAALFGTAADSGDSHQSRIRIRLSAWDMGQLKEWPRMGAVSHPEVPSPVGSDLYLGFGPLEYNRATRGTTLKTGAAIQASDNATLHLAFPEDHATELTRALWLMDRYGTLGGRSRNGWGSLTLTPADAHTAALEGTPPVRDWQKALQLDWPHALGSDQRGLLAWQTKTFDDWPRLMQELARLKIGLRTQFKFTTGKDAPRPEDRHWLAYPVTNHSVRPWGNNARLPNTLRFKVRPAPNDPHKLVGVIFHVPCLPPPSFAPDAAAIKAVWQQVHVFLDTPAQQLNRIPA
jgi:CRISPR-associated protein Cmr1